MLNDVAAAEEKFKKRWEKETVMSLVLCGKPYYTKLFAAAC